MIICLYVGIGIVRVIRTLNTHVAHRHVCVVHVRALLVVCTCTVCVYTNNYSVRTTGRTMPSIHTIIHVHVEIEKR